LRSASSEKSAPHETYDAYIMGAVDINGEIDCPISGLSVSKSIEDISQNFTSIKKKSTVINR
jgi:hypothetical protein